MNVRLDGGRGKLNLQTVFLAASLGVSFAVSLYTGHELLKFCVTVWRNLTVDVSVYETYYFGIGLSINPWSIFNPK